RARRQRLPAVGTGRDQGRGARMSVGGAAADGRLDLGDVSLVCVETRRPALALFALQRCLRQARFGEVRLLGARPQRLPDGIVHTPLTGIASVADYSRFMVKELGAHFAGTHALVV